MVRTVLGSVMKPTMRIWVAQSGHSAPWRSHPRPLPWSPPLLAKGTFLSGSEGGRYDLGLTRRIVRLAKRASGSADSQSQALAYRGNAMAVLRKLLALLLISIASGVGAQGRLVEVVEFYNQKLDHYFISSLQGDIEALDSGRLAGWARSGYTFKAYDAPASGMSPVCRFYIPPAAGDSHFYSASPSECAEVLQKFPAFVYESPAVMYAGLPDLASGACPAGSTPVYRLWNQRADSNHRYTTDTSVRSTMVARGYVPEGYGPDGVAMCAPSPVQRFEVTLAPATVLLRPGETREVYVTVRSRGGFSAPVGLEIAGLPPGVEQQLAASSLTVGPALQTTTLRLTGGAAAAPTANEANASVKATDAGGIGISAPLIVEIAAADDPDAARLATVADVERRLIDLRSQGLASAALVQAIAAFMQARPEYEATGADPASLVAWGRFRDGTLHIVSEAPPPERGSALTERRPVVAKAGGEVPQKALAAVMQNFGPNFVTQDTVDDIKTYLTSKGWRAGAADTSVNGLKGLRGYGFFYINTHGARWEVDNPAFPDGKIFALQTSTLVHNALDKTLLADRATTRLVHYTAPNGDKINIPIFGPLEVSDSRYGFTYLFVEAYMEFAKGAVVYIDACYGSRNSDFVNAFLKKGAGVYLGWSELISPSAVAKSAGYFVDRMVGANKHPTKESPPQRAFPYDLVLQDMTSKGLDRDAQYGAQLSATAGAGIDPPILAPSLRNVEVNEIDGKLTLNGYFGSQTGKVKVGGAELSGIDSWATDKIVANLPVTANGDVVVEVDGVVSNARQLTEWTIEVDYSNPIPLFGSYKYAGGGKLRFRADVAGYRAKPASPLTFVPRGGYATQDSKISVTASGTWAVPGCTSTLANVPGFGDYVSIARTGGLATGIPVVRALFSVDANAKSGTLGMLLAGQQFPHVNTACSGEKTYTIASMGLLESQVMLPVEQTDAPRTTPVPSIGFVLNPNLTIPALNSTKSGLSPLLGTYTVTTKPATPISPPRDTDDSGK
ncbi:MAG: hypothetical protein IT518_23425 [Burkholderiales bacterium]|nr:hypothetical protein [Burkholderiales bacterium]